ncbi:MAG: hypothetical protein M3R06_08060, partial [Chloroflexota bacterium]|nr:hypothetical protein [Chloroflexota bacterium]
MIAPPVALTTPPPTRPVIPGNIPPQLAERPQWVCWQWKWCQDASKPWTKIPLNAKTGGPAKTNDPTTWSTLSAALAHAQRPNIAGVGFVFSTDDPYVGIDVDKCRDPVTGDLTPEAQRIVTELDSYAELSPSGTGVHVIVAGSLPAKGRRRRG